MSTETTTIVKPKEMPATTKQLTDTEKLVQAHQLVCKSIIACRKWQSTKPESFGQEFGTCLLKEMPKDSGTTIGKIAKRMLELARASKSRLNISLNIAGRAHNGIIISYSEKEGSEGLIVSFAAPQVASATASAIETRSDSTTASGTVVPNEPVFNPSDIF